MIPAYRSMESYPFQRNQMPFPYYHHHHPGIEPIPPQMTMDPSKSHFPYEQPWPYANSYGHNHPIPTHFCCGHNNFPGYYGYRPYYHPHSSAPSPMYPSYGEPFFSPYSPQSHYTMELPRYEYDKYMPREREKHCCGCPNHSCNQKEGKSVRIEEQEADVGKIEKDDVVPVQLRNYPYPLVWIPPEYYGNKQLKNPSTNEASEQGKMLHDKKPHGAENFKVDEKLAQEPRVHWNGWFPFDIKSAPDMVQDGDGMRSQKKVTDKNVMESEGGRMDHKQESGHKRPEFQFPIIWFPYYNNQEEGGRTDNEKTNSTPECIQEVPHHSFKSVPVKSCVDEGVTNKTGSTNTRASDITEKVNNQRSIPVNQMEPHQEKNDVKGSEKREVDASLKKKEENVTKEDSHSSTKRGSTSPHKASKLPPVCLRVDPLPRKKNGNGSSRSPSPPSKKHSQEAARETNKTQPSEMNDKAKPDSNLHAGEEVTSKVRTILVLGNEVSKNKDGECRDESQNQINRPSGVPVEIRESNTDGGRYTSDDKKEDQGLENMTGEADEHSMKDTITPTYQGGKKEGNVLLDADAAVLIQAAYRGYQVRKWEPLKKLKQIAEVSKEVADARGSVQAFESSPDLQKDEKQKIAIVETIMRLLLKLDTLQGLHLSLRETRKSLARELVTLQEKLDSMMANRPQKQMQQFNVQEPVEVSPLNMENKEYHQDQQEEKLDVPKEDSSKGISGSSDETLEKHLEQLYMKDGDGNSPISDGERESQSSVDLPSNDREEHNELPSSLVEEEISPMVSVDAMDSTKVAECEAKSELNDILPSEIDEPDITALEELPVGVIDEDITSADSENNMKDELNSGLNSGINAMMELPVGLLDEDAATYEYGKDDETNISKLEVQAESEEFIEELPVGLLNEETGKFDVVVAEGEGHNSNEKAGSSTDDTAKDTQVEQSLLEEQVEVQSSGDSDGWVKIEFLKEDKIKGDAQQDRNGTKLPCLAAQVSDPHQGNEEVCLEANGAADILQEQIEFMPQVEEQLAQKETQVDSQEDKGAEDYELSDDLVAKHDEGNGDMKLLEESEKLRKLMKELLNVGNEQLSVISNLTGRVKDLEKKLAKSKRSKKVKTKNHKVATSKISHCYSSE